MTPAGSGAAVASIDRFVPHVSTVEANRGQLVGLFLRERAVQPVAAQAPVVLFVHGGFAPSAVAYDLDHGDYSYMAALARSGLDVFAMTHTGYGASPKPMMDDPCNVEPAFQDALIPHVLKEPCSPRYKRKLLSSQAEWDEIDTVVRYIMDLRKVQRVSLIGWSIGAPRVGGYAALNPGVVDKLVMLGPAPFSSSKAPADPMPEPGAPTRLQSRAMLLDERWRADVRCEGQIEDPQICDVVWRELMTQDNLGSQWAGDGRGIMRAPTRSQYGWQQHVPLIKAPTLILLGEFDSYQPRRDSWQALTVEHRVFFKINCASHFMQFEKPRHVLYRLTAEWLLQGTANGAARGEFSADHEGRIKPLAG
ncbi:MAG: alpha/beta hydrolase [Burkholderiales bacterium]